MERSSWPRPHERAIETDVARRGRGHDLHVRSQQIARRDAVFLSQGRQQPIGRRALSCGRVGRQRADDGIELLGPEHLRLKPAAKVTIDVRREIRDQQNGIRGIVADVDPRCRPIGLVHAPGERKRHISPLIVLDAAVHLRVDEHGLLAFPKRLRLELDPRRVDVGVDDAQAAFERLSTNDEEDDGAVAVDGVPARARLQARSGLWIPLAESTGLGESRRFPDELHLGLRFAEEALEVVRIPHHMLAVLRRQFRPGVRKPHILAAQRRQRGQGHYRNESEDLHN